MGMTRGSTEVIGMMDQADSGPGVILRRRRMIGSKGIPAEPNRQRQDPRDPWAGSKFVLVDGHRMGETAHGSSRAAAGCRLGEYRDLSNDSISPPRPPRAGKAMLKRRAVAILRGNPALPWENHREAESAPAKSRCPSVPRSGRNATIGAQGTNRREPKPWYISPAEGRKVRS